jgi:hypothetical protein
MALNEKDVIEGLSDAIEDLQDAYNFDEQVLAFRSLILKIFEYVYLGYSETGGRKKYGEFIFSLEQPSYYIVNEDIEKNLEKTEEGKWRGELGDTYFGIVPYYLPAVYFDAKLALDKGHFLTENHRFVLEKAGYGMGKLIEHNRKWAQRFENEAIEGEEELGAEHWRLNYELFIRREGKDRAHTPLPQELRKRGFEVYKELDKYRYYNQFEKELYRRNNFRKDPKWPVDFTKAENNYEDRLKKRVES